MSNQTSLFGNDRRQPLQKSVQGHGRTNGIRLLGEDPAAVARKVEYSLAEGLAGDSSAVNTDSTENVPSLNCRHAAAELSCLNCRSLTSRAGPNYDNVKTIHLSLLPRSE